MISDKPVDKVDVEELIKEFKVVNIGTFATISRRFGRY
jgi:hypothetical protein